MSTPYFEDTDDLIDYYQRDTDINEYYKDNLFRDSEVIDPEDDEEYPLHTWSNKITHIVFNEYFYSYPAGYFENTDNCIKLVRNAIIYCNNQKTLRYALIAISEVNWEEILSVLNDGADQETIDSNRVTNNTEEIYVVDPECPF